MYKLLNAGFSRLKKSKVFWGMVIINFGIAYYCLYSTIYDDNVYASLIFNIMILKLFIGIFVSLFVGLEYDNGTIKNKVIVGHSRINIYMSNFIISTVAGFFIWLSYMLTVLFFRFMLGVIWLPLDQILILALHSLFIIMGYSAVFNLISMICSNITMSTITCIFLAIGMFVGGPYLYEKSTAEAYYELQHTDLNGNIQYEKKENPNYSGEKIKQACKLIVNLIPSGQITQMSQHRTVQMIEKENLIIETEQLNESFYRKEPELIAYSLIFITITNCLGVLVFDKKELN